MGVNRTDYLMLGVDMGAADFDRDSFEAECDGAPNRRFDIIYDGMSGQYCIAGKIIAKSDQRWRRENEGGCWRPRKEGSQTG